ncbi:chaperonin 10-like protein [Peziza echinospora]|nr:chaperonin 10-like protein [Peziza echinospora]
MSNPPHTPGNSVPLAARAPDEPLAAHEVPITACVLTSPKTLALEPRILPAPPPGFLQLRIVSTALCGSDLHYWKHFRNGSIVPQSPLILGHESCGEVTAVGPPSSDALAGPAPAHEWKVGDLCALEVGIPCGACTLCLPPGEGGLGRYNICPNMRFRSSGRLPPPDFPGGGLLEGTLQGGLNHPAAWCHPLPPGFNPHLGSLLEPLAVAHHAMTRALPLPPTAPPPIIIVLGAGPVGLLISACLKRLPHQHLPPHPPAQKPKPPLPPPIPASQRPKIVICDIVQARLDFAVHEVGWADASILLAPALLKLSKQDLAVYISRRLANTLPVPAATGGQQQQRRIEAVFECTGVPSSLDLALHLCSPGGKILVLTIPPPETVLPLGLATLREVDIRGVFRYGPGDYERAIEVVREGRIRGLEKLVTHTVVGLGEVGSAMELLARGVDADGKDVVKVVVEGDVVPLEEGAAGVGLEMVEEEEEEDEEEGGDEVEERGAETGAETGTEGGGEGDKGAVVILTTGDGGEKAAN